MELTDKTPAQLAQLALEGIEQDQEAFRMNTWISFPEVGPQAVEYGSPEWYAQTLKAADNPAECGTTLCAAGWIVHVAGYGMDTNDNVLDREGNVVGWTGDFAERLLKLTHDQAWRLFYAAREEGALDMLRRLASGKKI
jgi:hypothetical protein